MKVQPGMNNNVAFKGNLTKAAQAVTRTVFREALTVGPPIAFGVAEGNLTKGIVNGIVTKVVVDAFGKIFDFKELSSLNILKVGGQIKNFFQKIEIGKWL